MIKIHPCPDFLLDHIEAACLQSYDEYGNEDALNILSIIKRLRAAEYALTNAPNADYYDDVFVDAVEQWRKAAGK